MISVRMTSDALVVQSAPVPCELIAWNGCPAATHRPSHRPPLGREVTLKIYAHTNLADMRSALGKLDGRLS